jgi:hypothetical protein
MWLMGVNSYDEDIKFQSSHRPQFLTHQTPAGASQSTRFCCQKSAIAAIAENSPRRMRCTNAMTKAAPCATLVTRGRLAQG